MEKRTISRDELHRIPHDLLVDMFLQMDSSLTMMQKQNETLIKQISGLQESIAVLTVVLQIKREANPQIILVP